MREREIERDRERDSIGVYRFREGFGVGVPYPTKKYVAPLLVNPPQLKGPKPPLTLGP